MNELEGKRGIFFLSKVEKVTSSEKCVLSLPKSASPEIVSYIVWIQTPFSRSP